MQNKINREDIEKILNFKVDERIAKRIEEYDLTYEALDKDRLFSYLNNVVNVLTQDIVKSGKHRIDDWEKGWGENLQEFVDTKNINSLIPKYHGKNRYVRWMGEIVNPITPNFDYKIHIILIDAILLHYIPNSTTNIFEFGCGPGYHLLRLSSLKDGLTLHGGDWAKSSQNIIKEVNYKLNTNIVPFNFNFFDPDYSIEVPKNSVFYTVAALEQIGSNIESYVNFILDKKPSLVINMEPIEEILDKNNLIDNLSILYFKKRNYLNGYLPHLEKLEKENKVKIITKQRIFSGSYFIEGHSLIVWKPL